MDQLKPGDRLPSERELSERLQAGRSSVREVLRALELLGLIETRRGEGTFLQPYHTHHLVELLANYILRDNKSRKDLLEMRILLETGAIDLIAKRQTVLDLGKMEIAIAQMEQAIKEDRIPLKQDQQFHEELIRQTGNHLLLRTWHPVYQYSSSCFKPVDWHKVLQEHKAIVSYLKQREFSKASEIIKQHLSD
jgi:GntR family transcriptional repressor for pyruvate dehydrogenase complex